MFFNRRNKTRREDDLLAKANDATDKKMEVAREIMEKMSRFKLDTERRLNSVSVDFDRRKVHG